MPPKKAQAQASATPLQGCVVSVSGVFTSYGTNHQSIRATVKNLGADFNDSMKQSTTHLITTQADWNRRTIKIQDAIRLGTLVVSYDWVNACINASQKVSECPYAFGPVAIPGAKGVTKTIAPPAPSMTNGAPNTAPAASPAAPATRRGSRKRAASAATDDGSDTGSQLPSQAQAQPPPKKKTAKTAKAAAPGPANGTLATAGGTDGTPSDDKMKQASKVEETQVSEGQVAKSRDLQIPLDEGCTLPAYTVYVDDSALIWDASLNQTNASNNNNKFYRLQVLHSGNGDYKTWSRWGRVGERGQSAVLGNGSLDDAIKSFEKKFKDKSGIRWEDRGSDPKPGKYAFVERSYNPESDDDGDGDDGVADRAGAAKKAEPKEPAKSTLPEPVQQLLRLIFNQTYFSATMTDLNYDANKLPLGKLSKATITRGFQALKDLSALFDDSSLATTKYSTTIGSATEHLSNLFYSLIPHAFGRNRPPIIASYDTLRREITLLESLSDMKDAALLLKAEKADSGINQLDSQYQKLGMEEMTPLDHNSTEFAQLKHYLVNTRGATHRIQYEVMEIFRIERRGERERFDKGKLAGPPRDRRLLWHGSRTTNFGGILSQGLRIAPPEAPVSGYMFGKGVYLADMSSKSANYCYAHTSGSNALLLLCEAELGNPMQHLTSASFTAGEDAATKGMFSTWGQGTTAPVDWKDAASVHPSLAGIKMPDTSTNLPGPTNIPGATLFYNEYIVYDIAQIRLRYLFRVKM